MKIQEICFMMSQALARQYICSKTVYFILIKKKTEKLLN